MRATIFVLASATASIALFATPAQAQDFSGPRVEANIGWDGVRVSDVPASTPDSLDAVRIGGAVGYDFELGEKVVLGGELGIGWDLDGSTSAKAGNTTVDFKPGYDFDASLRLGYKVTPRTLVYAKAGYANSQYRVRTTVTNGNASTVTTFKDDEDGYRVGLGLEHMFGDNVYAKAEYRYTGYGNDLSRHQALVGVGYRF